MKQPRRRLFFRVLLAACLASATAEAATPPDARALVIAPGAQLAFEVGDSLTAQVALDGGPLRPVAPDGFRAPSEGDHWLVTVSRNAAGVSSAPRWVWLRVDAVPPSVELSVAPAPWTDARGFHWVPPGAEVNARADDALAGVATVALTAGPVEEQAAADTVSVTLAGSGGDLRAAAHAIDRVGNTSEVAAIDLKVDAWPPAGTVRVDGAWVEASSGVVLGPHARLVLDDEDRGSGIAERRFEADGRATTAQVWGTTWRAGTHQASVRLHDHVGNTTAVTPLRFEVDAVGPTIEWRVTSQGAESEAGLRYYPSPVTVAASASDALAGLASLVRGDGRPLDEGTVVVDGSSLELAAADRVGNETRLTASWQIDDDPPRIEVLGPRGRPLPPGKESKKRLRLGSRLTLSVVDEGVGLAGATYVLNRLTIPGFAPAAAVPATLELPIKGQYMLTIEAVDLLGHQTRLQWLLNVGRGGR